MARPEVIAKLSNEFVPVALRAPTLHTPPPTPEVGLLKGLHDASIAPQGMFVLNSDGTVLTAVLMFDDTAAISDFLQMSLDEFRKHPTQSASIPPRRFMKYPSTEVSPTMKTPDSVAFSVMCQTGACGSTDPVFSGDLAIDMVARSLDADGKLSRDTLHQEHYSQDEILVPAFIERELVKTAQAAQSGMRLPESISRLLIQHAYLGHLDVQPLSPQRNANARLRKEEFRISAVANQPGLYQISGFSDVSAHTDAMLDDGATFRNEVVLNWRGYVQISGNRIVAIDLLAEGTQDLYWRTAAPIDAKLTNDQLVSMLPAGKPIALRQRVVMGFNGRKMDIGSEAHDVRRRSI